MTSRATANIAAAVAFLGVLLLGLYLVGSQHKVQAPITTTVVTNSAVHPMPASEKSTETVQVGKGKKTMTRTRKSSTAAATPQTTVTTAVSGGQSFLERVLGNDGEVFLRIGVILLAAFIAGAATQRVLVGQYGGIKVGALEVSDLATASDDALNQLKDALAKVQQDSAAKLAELEAALKKLQADLASTTADALERDAKLTRTLALVTTHLATIEQQANNGGT